jgi:hypothetical protein
MQLSIEPGRLNLDLRASQKLRREHIPHGRPLRDSRVGDLHNKMGRNPHRPVRVVRGIEHILEVIRALGLRRLIVADVMPSED